MNSPKTWRRYHLQPQNRYKGDMENLGKSLFLSKYKLQRTDDVLLYIFLYFPKVQEDIMFRLKMA